MRIGVIADTHIPVNAQALPKAILDDFKKVDMIIHAGDFVDIRVLNELKSLCSNVRAVSGNMDPAAIKEKLPEKEIIQAGSFKIGLMHGHGAPNNLINILNEAFKNEKLDIIIFGHSHSPLNEKKGNCLYFNPGSVTDKVYAPYNSYGIIEINDKVEAKIIKL